MGKLRLLLLGFLALLFAGSSPRDCLGGEKQTASPPSKGPSIDELIQKLGSPSYEERVQASAALIAEGERALDALRRAEQSPDPEVARRASACIAPIETRKKVASLVAKFHDANRESRGSAVSSLVNLGPLAASAVPAMLTALDSSSAELRQNAVVVLRSIGPAGKPAVPRLIRIVKNERESIDMRWWATIALGYIRSCPEQCVPVLLDLAQAKEPHLRNGAANALGKLGQDGKRVVPVLIQLLRDPDVNVQGNAAGSLGLFETEASSSIPALLELLKRYEGFQKEDDPRSPALWGLRHLAAHAGPAIPALLAIAENLKEDSSLRSRAIAVLRAMPLDHKAADAALRRLDEILESNDSVKDNVLEALAERRK